MLCEIGFIFVKSCSDKQMPRTWCQFEGNYNRNLHQLIVKRSLSCHCMSEEGMILDNN